MFLQVAEIEKRSFEANESPFLLSTAAGVSPKHLSQLKITILRFLFCLVQ